MMSVEDILIQSGDTTLDKSTPAAATPVVATPTAQPTPEQLATLNTQKPSQPTKIAQEGSLTKEQRETFLFWKEIGLAILWVIFLILSTIAVAKKLKEK